MGRTYESKNGRKTLVPTERQLQREKQTPLKSETGLKGFNPSKQEIEALKNFWNSMSAQERNRILEHGEATDKFAMLRLYQIYQESLTGKTINDMRDNQRYNIEKLANWWQSVSDHELIANYDKNNRFLGITVGGKQTVSVNGELIRSGVLVGGKSMHNHPTSPTQPLGMSFSIARTSEYTDQKGRTRTGLSGDLCAMKSLGTREMHVSAREGRYLISSEKGMSKLTPKLMEKYQAQLDVKTSIIRGFHVANGTETSDKYHRQIALAVHETVQSLAKAANLKYSFTPNKGFEKLYDRKHLNDSLPEYTR